MARVSGVREVPQGVDDELRGFLEDLRRNVVAIRTNQSPITSPTNFKVTPLPFGNLLQWTRTVNADYYEVLWNTNPTLQNANIQGVGDSAQHVDQVGNSGIKRFYWLRARKYTGSASGLTGPLSGVTLAATPGVTPPTPPPPSHIFVVDTTTGHSIIYVPFGGAGGGSGILKQS